MRKVGRPVEAPQPNSGGPLTQQWGPPTHLGQVPQYQHIPLGGPLYYPFPLTGHILILLSQGG